MHSSGPKCGHLLRIPRRVPDGRAPGALLDRLRDLRIAAALEARADGLGLRAVDARLVARARAPATHGVLEHAHVVERRARRIELGIAPDGAELVGTLAARLAGARVDARAVVSVAHRVDHLLVRRAVLADPELHDLRTLERRRG